MAKFILAIELGNEAMKGPEDISEALKRVAHVIGYPTMDMYYLETTIGSIRDKNGNNCGRYEVL